MSANLKDQDTEVDSSSSGAATSSSSNSAPIESSTSSTSTSRSTEPSSASKNRAQSTTNEQLTSKKSSSKSSSDTDKDPFYGLSFKVGVAENKNVNYRATMEDVHTYVANFAERLDWGYFAIFDGHAGKQTARWCGNNLHTLLEKEIIKAESRSNKHSTSSTSTSSSSSSPPSSSTSSSATEKSAGEKNIDSSAPLSDESDMREHMHNSFVKADELISKEVTGSSGSTAAVAVLRWETDSEKVAATTQDVKIDSTEADEKKAPKKERSNSSFDFVPQKNHKRMLYTSNVGDSRIILSRKGKPYRLSYDHKASDVNEINRIRSAGGLIMKNRVNGVLAVARSLGDSYMKDLVIGKPYTTATEIGEDDEFLIIACDGLWDVISDLQACQYVSKALEHDNNPATAAKKLCQLAMDASTTDNVTVMIVLFDRSVFSLGEAVKKLTV